MDIEVFEKSMDFVTIRTGEVSRGRAIRRKLSVELVSPAILADQLRGLTALGGYLTDESHAGADAPSISAGGPEREPVLSNETDRPDGTVYNDDSFVAIPKDYGDDVSSRLRSVISTRLAHGATRSQP